MAKTLTFVIAPNGERWGIWLDGLMVEEPSNEASARESVRVRLDGVHERGDIGRLVVATEPPGA